MRLLDSVRRRPVLVRVSARGYSAPSRPPPRIAASSRVRPGPAPIDSFWFCSSNLPVFAVFALLALSLGSDDGGECSFRLAFPSLDRSGQERTERKRFHKASEPMLGGAQGFNENIHNSFDEALILKRKSEEVLPYLNGRCIYLVGMMGSGKSTVGKILSEVLCYSFFDSDKLVEQAVGVSSVAQIFKDYSEAFFRDNESEVLKDLASMRRLVVATGGGAVIRPINWKYMKQGITVWLDVPLDALARRIAAVGTASRPLLHQEPGDPYSKAFAKLTALSEERGKAYANAVARVSLEDIATKKGHEDVSALTPTDIAFEALIKIENNHVSENAAVSKRPCIRGMKS
ncbi:hypothetical protein OPV22_015402 [Ensete ventricosum]|uniref:shikimate kinase n=1 Tax=Ensete ventricosum TaxID=4639 RepID=A0AAV8RE33_ENSVE|nr:hypothetical protein OPV22_015402 [Ensete ventricosum]